MLRVLVLLLLLANLLTGAYALGWLQSLGLSVQSQHEPERLTQQVSPERLRVLNGPTGAVAQSSPVPDAPTESPVEAPTEATPLTAAAAPPEPPKPLPTSCWQVSGYNPAQAIVLNAALQDVPALNKRWALSDNVLPARWIVYLGKFPTTDVVQKRKAELREAKIEFRDVKTAALAPGLALGTYSTEEAAQTALRDAKRAGVRDAKVVQERSESRTVTLRLPAITDRERAQVQALTALGGKDLLPCP